MFSRLSQVARHLSRPLPNYAHTSAAAVPASRMTSLSAAADVRNSRTIHTAACLIIGDEVLGGKVSDGWVWQNGHGLGHSLLYKRWLIRGTLDC